MNSSDYADEGKFKNNNVSENLYMGRHLCLSVKPVCSFSHEFPFLQGPVGLCKPIM